MKHGFTIVELLIAIVVIAILAAITIVSYNGIQNRANDTSIQSDLKNLGTKVLTYQATEGAVPATGPEFASMEGRVSPNAYGSHFQPTAGNNYNMAYCYNASTKAAFVLVAASRSGNVYVFRDGGVKLGIGPMQTVATTCANNGISTNLGYIWLYNASVWQYNLAS
ncbi:pilin like protein competence factor [Candidatus Saccharibacteria bacterium RAAC3_TM7_1]|nr:pilin like protein competence factor [Candidatus Saccharibacteria bacterium RAAC3_TM7_1]HCZ28649.1 prepilin-type N-terminal cleavage/methylation domain-containing protein [Candidatus Saccharibacteria bacterium]